MSVRRTLRRFSVFAAALALGVWVLPARGAEPQLAHMVFFTLKDSSEAARGKLVSSCKNYLSDHEGVVYFSVGTIAEDVREPVSDREFDVALHLVFKDKGAEETYIKSARHQRFVDENKATWSKVRVFDSYVSP